MPTWKSELVAANANLVVLVAAVNARFKTHFSAQQFFYLHIRYFPADCLIPEQLLACSTGYLKFLSGVSGFLHAPQR